MKLLNFGLQPVEQVHGKHGAVEAVVMDVLENTFSPKALFTSISHGEFDLHKMTGKHFYPCV